MLNSSEIAYKMVNEEGQSVVEITSSVTPSNKILFISDSGMNLHLVSLLNDEFKLSIVNLKHSRCSTSDKVLRLIKIDSFNVAAIANYTGNGYSGAHAETLVVFGTQYSNGNEYIGMEAYPNAYVGEIRCMYNDTTSGNTYLVVGSTVYKQGSVIEGPSVETIYLM